MSTHPAAKKAARQLIGTSTTEEEIEKALEPKPVSMPQCETLGWHSWYAVMDSEGRGTYYCRWCGVMYPYD